MANGSKKAVISQREKSADMVGRHQAVAAKNRAVKASSSHNRSGIALPHWWHRPRSASQLTSVMFSHQHY